MEEFRSVEFYTPTQRFSAFGFTIAVLTGSVVALALGLAYGSVQILMPIIYVCFLVTVLFATLMGYATFSCVKLGRVRHRGVATAVGVVAGIAGLYGAWAADRYVRLKLLRVEGVDFSLSPGAVGRYLEYFLENGLWQFRGQPVYGLPLLCIWLVEAAILFALSVKAIRTLATISAYCESCRRWTRKSKGVRSVIPNISHGLTQELNKGNLQALHEAMPIAPGSPLALRVDIDQCPSCAQSVFLSMTVVSGGTKFRQFVWPEEKALLRHLRIAPADAEALRAPQKLAQIVPPGKSRPPKK
jgi:hypothetical protein